MKNPMISIDAHLAEVGALQSLFKTDSLKAACIAIARSACTGSFWPDELQIDLPKSDSNCIGNAYKIMADILGVIHKAEPFDYRRSTKGPSAGRMIFRYICTDYRRARAIAFLAGPKVELLLPIAA